MASPDSGLGKPKRAATELRHREHRLTRHPCWADEFSRRVSPRRHHWARVGTASASEPGWPRSAAGNSGGSGLFAPAAAPQVPQSADAAFCPRTTVFRIHRLVDARAGHLLHSGTDPPDAENSAYLVQPGRLANAASSDII